MNSRKNNIKQQSLLIYHTRGRKSRMYSNEKAVSNCRFRLKLYQCLLLATRDVRTAEQSACERTSAEVFLDLRTDVDPVDWWVGLYYFLKTENMFNFDFLFARAITDPLHMPLFLQMRKNSRFWVMCGSSSLMISVRLCSVLAYFVLLSGWVRFWTKPGFWFGSFLLGSVLSHL